MKSIPMTPTDLESLARALLKVDFFSNFTISELDDVLQAISLFEYESGDYVFKQGAPGDAFYIIHTGSVEVLMKKAFFFKKTVAELQPGSFFGEIALLDQSPRTATIRSKGCRLFTLLASDFSTIVRKNPRFAEELRRVVARRKFQNQNKN